MGLAGEKWRGPVSVQYNGYCRSVFKLLIRVLMTSETVFPGVPTLVHVVWFGSKLREGKLGEFGNKS